MRRTIALVLTLVAVPVIASAQAAQNARPAAEIGVRGGWMRFSEEFGDYSIIAMPAGVFGPAGGMHLTLFASPRVAIEPQLGILRISDEGGSFTLTHLAVQVMGFLVADANHAPYVFAQLATLQENETGGGSGSQNAFGGGVGYRTVIRQSLGIRYEARYRRWSGRGQTINELGLLIGVGAVLGRKGNGN